MNTTYLLTNNEIYIIYKHNFLTYKSTLYRFSIMFSLFLEEPGSPLVKKMLKMFIFKKLLLYFIEFINSFLYATVECENDE